MLYRLDIYKNRNAKTIDARHYVKIETTADLNRILNVYASIGKYVNYFIVKE
jgi:hypothetical protein